MNTSNLRKSLNTYRCESSQCRDNAPESWQGLPASTKGTASPTQEAIVAIANNRGILTYVNDKFCEISGYTPSELLGRTYHPLNPHSPAEAFTQLRSRLHVGNVWRGAISHRAKDGTPYTLNTTIFPCLDQHGHPWQYSLVQFAVSETKHHPIPRRQLFTPESTPNELSPIGLFRTDSRGQFVEVNSHWCQMTGLMPEAARGEGWQYAIHCDDRKWISAEWHEAVCDHAPFYSTEYRLESRQGSITWVLLQAVAQVTDKGASLGYVGTIVDITERKQAEEQLRHQAWHDALTDLPNRALFLQRLETAIRRSRRFQGLFTVLFLDLNRFKVINDSLGHLAGDRLLCEVARRLSNCLRSQDTIARFGGDEFAILLDKIGDLNDVFQVVERIQRQLAQPFYLDKHQVFSSASIGIVLCGQPLPSEELNVSTDEFPHCPLPDPITPYHKPEDILRAADTAMYRAKKQEGLTAYAVFNPQMYAQALALLEWENDLRRAVENCEEFVLHYQPIFASNTKAIVGFEALVRWQHPTRGLVYPNDFISLAEETGLIVPLGRYVLLQAAMQLQRWQSTFGQARSLTMNVNLSPKQFSDPDLVEYIDRVLQDVGIEGSYLNLEITESALMDNPETAAKMLVNLRKRGIHLSIDDFGTGYSSLSHLVRFPINSLKIDRSFIQQLGEGDKNSMVWAIVTLAHNLGLDVVAEGVETGLQLEQLTKLQCEKAQGYLFSTPLDVQTATALLIGEQGSRGAEENVETRAFASSSSGAMPDSPSKIPMPHAPCPIPNSQSLEKRLLKLARREKLLKRRLASQIRNSLDFNTILETAINEIRNLMQVECCQFVWYRPDETPPRFEPIRQICQLKQVCSGCLPPKLPTIAVLDEALFANHLLRIDDVATDTYLEPESRASLQARGVKSLLAIAVRPNIGKVGAIVCERRKSQPPWQVEEIELLQDMAEQLAIAIDHAHLYEQSLTAAGIANAQAVQMHKALEELKRTQSQLIQTEKMSSLGLLVAGVAHEINNPVNFISGNISHARRYAQELVELLDLYQTHYPEPIAEIQQLREAIDLGFVRDDLPKVMASMAMGTSRIQEIVQSLRKFSRVDEAAMKGVNIHDGIESTLLILQNRLRKGEKDPNSGVEIVREYGDLPLVECYAGQLNQVFMNILCNAIDALDSYRAARYARASSSQEREPYTSRITIRTEITPANTLLVCIQDNGPGMSDEVRKRLFDPFFTTKPIGKGTGLGLSISYHIVVEKHRGKLDCLSVPGKGAQFRIEIPVRQPAASLVGADICPNCIEPSQCRTTSTTCQHLHGAKE